MPDELQPTERRRKVPASYSTNPLAAIMEFGSKRLTRNRNHKRQKRTNRLQEYFDDPDEDLSKDEDYQELMIGLW